MLCCTTAPLPIVLCPLPTAQFSNIKSSKEVQLLPPPPHLYYHPSLWSMLGERLAMSDRMPGLCRWTIKGVPGSDHQDVRGLGSSGNLRLRARSLDNVQQIFTVSLSFGPGQSEQSSAMQ
ncbi:hypothetical protein PoB_004472700 [Plakobranchus ocellatus]|uniref:Uncharacterized protein n=1 Tax=Plakobranchus ocellatus TaxID=259542 RepID=A0AAV4BG52_9GAST|nr:hypothetical protein PoB_004472700 [Plakobranchus ocellatus]